MNSYNNIPGLAQFNFPDVERPPILIFLPRSCNAQGRGFFANAQYHPPLYARFSHGSDCPCFAPQKMLWGVHVYQMSTKKSAGVIGAQWVDCVSRIWCLPKCLPRSLYAPGNGLSRGFFALLGTFLGCVRGVILCYRVACSAQWQSMILQVQKHSRRNTP